METTNLLYFEGYLDDTLIHISHLHTLHLTDVNTTDAPPPECHACGHSCTDSVYQCAPCRYVLHPACARMGRTMRHPAHPEHPLSLQLAPQYETGCHLCAACRVGGHSFSFHCERCGFDLHLPCAALPEAATVPAHTHPLKLTYEDPLKGNGMLPLCLVCNKGFSTAQWFYLCEECDFGGHVGCVVPDTPAKDLYPRIDVAKMRAEEEATNTAEMRAVEEARKTAALLQQYQQMSALISAQSSMFVSNTASMASLIAESQKLAVRAADHNLENNFNKPGTEQEIRRREEHYVQRRQYSK